jgi:hypothetical protein
MGQGRALRRSVRASRHARPFSLQIRRPTSPGCSKILARLPPEYKHEINAKFTENGLHWANDEDFRIPDGPPGSWGGIIQTGFG